MAAGHENTRRLPGSRRRKEADFSGRFRPVEQEITEAVIPQFKRATGQSRDSERTEGTRTSPPLPLLAELN